MNARVVSRGTWSVYGIPSPSFTTGSLGSRSSAGGATPTPIRVNFQPRRRSVVSGHCVRQRDARVLPAARLHRPLLRLQVHPDEPEMHRVATRPFEVVV